jgi:hypothetical protein
MFVTICEGGSYNFQGNILTIAGTYLAFLTTADGCDSTIILTLSIAESIETSVEVTICEGESYSFGSAVLTQSGTYQETFVSQQGCDSIVTLTLTVLPLSTQNISASICEGESYNFNGEILTVGGIYADTVPSPAGCPQVVVLTLTVHQSAFTQITATICANEFYFFGGQQLNTAGTYTDVLTTVNGCDSIVELTLFVNPVYEINITEEICEGEFVSFGGSILSQPGTYVETFSSQQGCDSVVTLNLIVYPVAQTNFTASICQGTSLSF